MKSRWSSMKSPRPVLACLLLATWAGAWAPTPAVAQTKIEDLERKLEEAKERKRREAQRPAAPSPAAPANTGRVVVDVDAACELRVNGERVRTLQAGDTTTITVPAGEQLIECLSTSFQGVKVRKVLAVEKGKQAVLTLPLRAEEAGPREAAQAEERKRRVVAEMAQRNRPVSSEVLFDSKWGLQWTRSDNGSDVNWAEAQSHCRGLGGGWSLPTVEQLQSLYDAALPSIRCGSSYCEVSDQFRLSSYWFWSSEPNGSSEAWSVDLDDGSRSSYRVGSRYYDRALCVRRP